MKTILKVAGLVSVLLSRFCSVASAQSETVIPPSNRSTTSMEKNLLFFADQRLAVTQTGSTSLPLSALFDGNFHPLYSTPVNPSDPYIVLIENLPDAHVQTGAWIGWTTRYYSPSKFKIEVYNSYDYGGSPGYPSINSWVTVADIDNYTGGSFITQVYNASVRKIRLTIYNAHGPNNEVGLSELFFIHPEATAAYDNLMVKYNSRGNVGIGTTDPKDYKLAVNGKIRAEEIKVEKANWPDYVFDESYQLPSLQETEKHIKDKGHLPGIPSAAEVKANGIDLGEMNAKLLQKIEELTLHLIEMKKENDNQRKAVKDRDMEFQAEINDLKSKIRK